MEATYDTILCVMLGIGLSAACGFRVFVPLLVMSIAAMAGRLDLAQGFDWVATWPALIAFSVATALEITGYFVPWVDHLLDTIASPCAIIAGVIASAAAMDNMSPMMQWTLAIVTGGGAAAAVQATTVSVRLASTTLTGGLTNPVVAVAEGVSSTVLSVLAILIAPLAVALVILMLVGVYLTIRRLRRKVPTGTPVQM